MDAGAARRTRVERVIAAGARIADPRDPLGEEARRRLPLTSGLSPEGVELALGRHLEIAPSRGELDALVATSGRARRCHVVLAANVCTAPLRAIAVAAATAPEVFVRPSRRDPVVAELLARALQADEVFARAQGAVALVADLQLDDAGERAAGDARLGDGPRDGPRAAPDAEPRAELHVYGTDRTVATLRAQAGPGVLVRGHGAGLGLAVVGADADLAEAARAIASDVVPFDQRGCLSPRFALVEGSAGRAEALARALHEALELAGAQVPRGPLDGAARAEIAMYRATLEAVGSFWEGEGHGVGLDPAPRALLLPPAARVVHVVPVTAGAAAALLAPIRGALTAIGAGGGGQLAAAASALAPRARASALGWMQRPPLDGPVDLRTL
ncbi:proline dehydrogenase [Sorangium cellulosum]|uniref:Proline dehydrogenase n=1 Tax=Sorangium cellulosum TaxID=56 RepID=A0A4P2QAS5_SORCE|nr:acyl-CoA reductase [Sorangium cellulosum]AUX26767.1 proline dehydrogenase [Sorangium cellulosum]